MVGNPQRGIGSIQLDGGSRGSLCFQWHEDRYRHAWSFADSDVRIQSIESSSKELWPASPPLQQIHRQSFGDGREVIFGVGMSGRGHWSASFTLVPDLKCWIVELACRSSVKPGHLSSSYEIIDSTSPMPVEASSDQAYWIDSDRGISMEAIAPSTYVQRIASALDLNNHQLRFQPVQSQGDTATIQWAFRLRA